MAAMADPLPLLSTKLTPPPARARLVARPRLAARLAEGLSRPLTLIAAPAGFGKTTLLASWLAEPPGQPAAPGPLRVAWLSLDADDNDPARFFSYLAAALGRAHPALGATALALLQMPQPPPLESILTTLINDMGALDAALALALDDYHAISNHAIHAALAFLIERLPAPAHLFLLTRADPPLPLARMRARDQLAELRANDLRFTPDEAARFMSDSLGLELAPADVAALEARTEGWAAALQLAGLALRGRADAHALVDGLAGQRFLVDYLVDEVLGRQPPEIQRFLLCTAVLERMCAPLCDALLAEGAEPPDLPRAGAWAALGGALSPSQAVIEALDRANLFVVPLDDQRQWYRYHHLFADFLRGRLGPRAQPLHARAAAWYERSGLIDEAIHHALAAGDAERAAGLIETHAVALVMRGRNLTLNAWLGRLPPGMPNARPGLLLTQAAIATNIGDYLAVEPLLDSAAALIAPGDPYQSMIDALRAIVLSLTADPRAFPLAQQVLAALPADAVATRVSLTLSLGIAATYTGNLAEAERLHQQAIDASQRDEALRSSETAGLAGLAVVRRFQGRLRHSEQLSAQARALSAPNGQPLPTAGTILAWMEHGMELRERHQLAEAERALTQAIAVSRQWGDTDFTEVYAPLCLGLVLLSAGRAAAARECMQAVASAVARHRVAPVRQEEIAAYAALSELRAGRMAAAMRWAAPRLAAPNPPLTMYTPALLVLARVLLAQGRADEAQRRIVRVLAQAESAGYGLVAIEALVLMALAARAQGQPAEARAALLRALELAAPEGYIRPFADEGAPVGELLRQLLAEGAGPAGLAEQILAALPALPDSGGEYSQPLAEPLSQRELEILRLIDAGRSNREIAGQLVIEVSTVKRHVNNLFAKLAVGSRTQALARARTLGLL